MLGDFPSNAVLVVPSVVRNDLRVVADGTRSVQRLIAPIDVAVEVNESDGERLVEALEPALAGLPPLLRQEIIAMFGADARVESPASLASRAGMSRRSLDRWLARASAPSGRRLVALAPTLRALRLLRETSLPNRAIAAICGLRSPRRLHDYTLELTGRTPQEIRESDETMETLVERIVDALSVTEH